MNSLAEDINVLLKDRKDSYVINRISKNEDFEVDEADEI